MAIGQYLHVLRTHWMLVVSSILVCVAGAALLAWTTAPTYAAKTQLFVAAKSLSSQGGQAYEGGLYAQQRARSYAEIISSPRGAQAVIDDLGLDASVDDVQDQIRATVPPDSVLIDVTVMDPSPEVARSIANSIGAQLPALAERLERPEGSERSPVKVTVTIPARLPTNPVAPKMQSYLALAALFGLVLGVGGAVLRYAPDRRIRSDAETRLTAGAPVLARIAERGSDVSAAAMTADPASAASEGYRVLRANLHAIGAEHDLRSFVVSSAVVGEGKTEVVANLGLALARAGDRVVVVDANLRAPRLAARLGMRSRTGLADFLEGRVQIEHVLRSHPSEPLTVLTSGSVRPNPSELLDSELFNGLLEALTEWFRFIIVDTPAMLAVSDAAAAARCASGTILVARAAATSTQQLHAARRALRVVDARVLGVVLNRARERDRWPYRKASPPRRSRVLSPVRADGQRPKLDSPPPHPTPLVRAISRFAVGGSVIQAISLTRLLEPRYRTTLVKGLEEPREGTLNDLAEALDVHPVILPSLRREPGVRDIAAVWGFARILRRERPAILHTHTAKAGTVGRVAAILAGGSRPPVVVHTFHGHVLEGYFSPLRSAVFRTVERILARVSTRLIVVSEEVKRDLIRLGIADGDRIVVVPLGFDLEPLVVSGPDRMELRESARSELSIPPDRRVITFVGRVVPIKRVDRFLAIAERLREREDDVHFLIVGDGGSRPQLEFSATARALGDRLTWAGFRRDLAAIYAASDVVTLTSDNEGTPVSLIEAQASGVPVVTTDVGGARAVVEDGVSGRVLDPGDEPGMADAIAEILHDPELAARFTAAGRESALSRFTLARLVRDIDELYARLLEAAGVPVSSAALGP